MTSEDRPAQPAAPDPAALLRSPSYLVLLLFGAILGAPVAAVAYFFLKAVAATQTYLYTTLPGDLGFSSPPSWWPIPLRALSGLIVALTITHLPGESGHKPAEGFKTGGPVMPIDLPGIILASFATLSMGVVLGPEAPLIAIGSGLGVLAVRLLKRDAPDQAYMVIGAAGSFAAIASLLGSPLAGAFLLMEAAGLGGPMMGVVLVPGLLAAGVGVPHLRRTRCLDRLRHLRSRHSGSAAGQHTDRRPVRLGHSDRSARRLPRRRDHPSRTRPAGDRRTPKSCVAPPGRCGDRRRRAGVRRDDRRARLRGAVLRPGPTAGAPHERCRLDGRRSGDAGRLQEPGLLALAERVSRRPRVSGDVHRRRRRYRLVAPSRVCRWWPARRWASGR